MPRGHRIYHISDTENFMSIVSSRALLSRNALVRGGQLAGVEPFIDLAEPEIVEKRAQKRVPVSPGGYLTDYVPFFFQPSPPMLFALLHRDPKPSLMQLVTSVESLAEAGLPFVFTDRHAINRDCRFYNRLEDLDKLNWDIILGRTQDSWDEQAKLIRQAEFLVFGQVPLELIQEIVVGEPGQARKVSKVLRAAGLKIAVRVARRWYDT